LPRNADRRNRSIAIGGRRTETHEASLARVKELPQLPARAHGLWTRSNTDFRNFDISGFKSSFTINKCRAIVQSYRVRTDSNETEREREREDMAKAAMKSKAKKKPAKKAAAKKRTMKRR
jgi:hypothetical protein